MEQPHFKNYSFYVICFHHSLRQKNSLSEIVSFWLSLTLKTIQLSFPTFYMHLFLEFSNLFTRIPYFILNFKKIHGNTFLQYITELLYIYIYIYIYIYTENKAFTTSDKSRSNTWLARVVPRRKGTYITHCNEKCKPKPAPCHPNRKKCKWRFHKERFTVTKVQKI